MSKKAILTVGLIVSLGMLVFYMNEFAHGVSKRHLLTDEIEFVHACIIECSNIPFALQEQSINEAEISESQTRIDSLLELKVRFNQDSTSAQIFSSLKIVSSSLKLILNEPNLALGSKKSLVRLTQSNILREQRILKKLHHNWIFNKRNELNEVNDRIAKIAERKLPLVGVAIVAFLVVFIIEFTSVSINKSKQLEKLNEEFSRNKEFLKIETEKYELLRTENEALSNKLAELNEKLEEKTQSNKLRKEEKRSIELSLYFRFQPILKIVKGQAKSLLNVANLNEEETTRIARSLNQRLSEVEEELDQLNKNASQFTNPNRVFLAPVISTAASKFELTNIKLKGSFPQVLVYKKPFLQWLDYFFIFVNMHVQDATLPIAICAKDKVIEFVIVVQFSPNQLSQEANEFLDELSDNQFSKSLEGIELVLYQWVKQQQIQFSYNQSRALFTFQPV